MNSLRLTLSGAFWSEPLAPFAPARQAWGTPLTTLEAGFPKLRSEIGGMEKEQVHTAISIEENGVPKNKMVEECERSLGEWRLSGFDPKQAGPIIEVFSVNIHSDHEMFANGKPFQIYGTIEVTDGKGNSFCIYQRDLDNPETISQGGTLSLTGPMEDCIKAYGVVALSIDLREKGEGVTLIKKDQLPLEYSDAYDQAVTKLVHGGGYAAATVHFIAYEAAMLGWLEIGFGNDKDIEIYGTVTTHCVGDYEYDKSIEDCKVYHSTTLYAQPQNQPLVVEPLGVVGLYRSAFGVRIHTFLVVEVDLWKHDITWEHYKGLVEFKANNLGLCTKDVDREDTDSDTVDIEFEDGYSFVEVYWNYPNKDRSSQGGKVKRSIEGSLLWR